VKPVDSHNGSDIARVADGRAIGHRGTGVALG
jgi:hypothetical protein